ncbi:MAG: N-acetylneuraminate synthase family protein [Chloroflexi bacterium]|nr:N-acetylneuraminate synthase family protein [Chloroflexota bacterium]
MIAVSKPSLLRLLLLGLPLEHEQHQHHDHAHEDAHPVHLHLAGLELRHRTAAVAPDPPDEVDRAVDILRGRADLTLMHTTSSYPCQLEDIHLRNITTLRQRYNLPTGFSCHYAGVGGIDAAAVALGAVAIERHVTLDRTMKGSDHAASLEPQGIETVVRQVRSAQQYLGSTERRVRECELATRAKVRPAA